MKITFLGHAGLLVEGAGKRIAIDPFLKGNPVAKLQSSELEVDYIVLTHGHGDHAGDAAEIALANHCPVIAVVELAGLIGKSGAQTIGMNTGGTCHLTDQISVKLTQAFHSSSYEIDGVAHYAGQPQGVILTVGNRTLYHLGDTALFSDIQLIGELNEIDVAAVPVGDYFTMGPKEALLAAKWTKAKHIIPIHFNTFPPIKQDGADFTAKLAKQDQIGHELEPGQALEL